MSLTTPQRPSPLRNASFPLPDREEDEWGVLRPTAGNTTGSYSYRGPSSRYYSPSPSPIPSSSLGGRSIPRPQIPAYLGSPSPTLTRTADFPRYPPRSISPTPIRSSSRQLTPTSTTSGQSPTFSRAINTTLPHTPPSSSNSAYTTPSRRVLEEHELSEILSSGPIRITDSPFDDRNSIMVDALPYIMDEEELDFEEGGSHGSQKSQTPSEGFNSSPTEGKRQKTMPNYRFAKNSPRFSEKRDEIDDLDVPDYEEDEEKDQFPVRPITEYRRSLYPVSLPIPSKTYGEHPDLAPVEIDTPNGPPPYTSLPPIQPRFRKLFTQLSPKDRLTHLLPAILISMAASLVQPYMSIIIGDAFGIFTQYPLFTLEATEEQRDALRNGIQNTSMKLALTGLYAVTLNYLKGGAWARFGEATVAKLREQVYTGVQNKKMEWFDLGMGMRQDEMTEGESVGAGGLMAKFARETDDVRIGTSQSSGVAIQNVSTFIFCFALALQKAPTLALVTLSTIPLVIIVQIITQIFAAPLYATERRAFAEASTNVERATSAISTVKAHNAQKSELNRFIKIISRATKSLTTQAVVWGVSMAFTDFLLLATFVTGFWYGAKVVRDGTVNPASVMTTFWACLLAASYLQSSIPQLTSITKAKMSLASLLTIIQEDPTTPNGGGPSPHTPATPIFPPPTNSPALDRIVKKTHRRTVSAMSKIKPIRCHGEFNLQNVSFAYPSRPDNPVLRDITLFLPPHETTFIVGGSGSGKSTIAQLLLRLYIPDGGDITMDDQSLRYLDPKFCQTHIAGISQGCILFDMSIHDNVAIGISGSPVDVKTGIARKPKDVSREEVVAACKMAMIHDWVEGLPEGYDTKLGSGGSSLSGGQKQRLAIARAKIRDPTVLILDEATSALDATSRVAVFENIKAWRQNRTTIVITHDLSQIQLEDFAYVMKDGVVAEQGFRCDLNKRSYNPNEPLGIFAALEAEQEVEPVPPKMEDLYSEAPSELMEELMEEDFQSYDTMRRDTMRRANTSSFSLRPASIMYLDLLDEYSRGKRFSSLIADPIRRPDSKASSPLRPGFSHHGSYASGISQNAIPLTKAQKRLSWMPADHHASVGISNLPYLASRSHLSSSLRHSRSYNSFQSNYRGSSYLAPPNMSMSRAGSRESFRSAPRAALALPPVRGSNQDPNIPDDFSPKLPQFALPDSKTELDIAIHSPPLDSSNNEVSKSPEGALPSIFWLIGHYYPTLPRKYLLFLGVFGSIAHGLTTPIWSFYLTKLMQIVGSGGTDPTLTFYGLVVLAISAGQGFSYFLQEYALYASAAYWTAQVREIAYQKLLGQDKKYYDTPQNDPARLVQIMIKDADDMRALMGDVIGKCSVFVSMIGLGIIWAMVVGWRLTLIGVALAPIFGLAIMFNEVMIGRAEVRNKRRREGVSKTFYESVANVRGIRAMALNDTFREKFVIDANRAQRTGQRAGWVVAIGTAVSASLPLFAMALMNWAGAAFMLSNFMNYVEMLQVYNLVLFSLTFGTQALDFIPLMAKVKAAARDFNRLFDLSENTDESIGELRYPITGNVTFSNISFSYPARPDVPILSNLSFSLTSGESVAIVGPSGSGKSTIAALLQRLYEPSSGNIWLDKYDIQKSETKWLRNHIAVVSQTANLFDATIRENIAYGNDESSTLISDMEIQRAAKAANIHEWILSLPDGYNTNLGENASLISGGQAQRLQIARALVRQSNILILDECTSALDGENQKAILDTVESIKDTRTTILITHSVEAMKRCDRIICLGEGRVIEDGSFEELSQKGGVFTQLMKMGEWE